MAGKYAEGTGVSVDRSRLELEKLLARFGADQFMGGWDTEANRTVVAFKVSGRQIRLELPMPARDDPSFHLTRAGRSRTEDAAQASFDQEVRRRWRSLILVVKAKLTAVSDGISTLEREFMADLVLPSGVTLGEWAHPQIEAAYRTHTMPALLPGGTREIEQ